MYMKEKQYKKEYYCAREKPTKHASPCRDHALISIHPFLSQPFLPFWLSSLSSFLHYGDSSYMRDGLLQSRNGKQCCHIYIAILYTRYCTIVSCMQIYFYKMGGIFLTKSSLLYYGNYMNRNIIVFSALQKAYWSLRYSVVGGCDLNQRYGWICSYNLIENGRHTKRST